MGQPRGYVTLDDAFPEMRDEVDELSVKDFEGANAEAEKQLSAKGSDAIKAVLKARGWGCMVSALLLPMAMVNACG